MPRNREDSRYQRNDQDRWDDDEIYDDDGYDEYDDTNSQALIAYGESEYLPALTESQEYGAIVPRIAPTIIPGAGLAPKVQAQRRKRPLSMQLLVTSVTVCIILAAMFSFVPLNNVAAATFGGPIDTLTNVVNFSRQQSFWTYRAHPGDTFESIAKDLNVNEKGIFQLNTLFADAEIQVGKSYKIPSDPNFGDKYIVPLPPGLNQCGYYNGIVNILSTNGFLFCASAGKDNGVAGTCAPETTIANGDAAKYNLEDPLHDASPAAHWGRGFTDFHSGVDLSNAVVGTKEYAADDGTVIYAGFDAGGGGNSIKINLCGGLAVSYSHLVDYALVKVNDKITKGQLIGFMGNSGRSFGAHVHFMLWWDNIPVDPLCAYGSLYGYSQSYHDGGCPPNITHDAWYHG